MKKRTLSFPETEYVFYNYQKDIREYYDTNVNVPYSEYYSDLFIHFYNNKECIIIVSLEQEEERHTDFVGTFKNLAKREGVCRAAIVYKDKIITTMAERKMKNGKTNINDRT